MRLTALLTSLVWTTSLSLAQQSLAQASLAQKSGNPAAPNGPALYEKRCAACHDHPVDRIPPRATLEGMNSARIMRTLDFGAMMTVAYTLKRDERQAIADFIGKAGPEPGPAPEAYCKDRSVTISDSTGSAWNGWSPSKENTRFVPANAARMSVDQARHLKLKWAFGFEGDISAMALPAMIGSQIFIGSAGGLMHAIRADTGCLQWVFQAIGPIRAAAVVVPLGKGHALLFGDLTGWFYALDAETGKLLWKKRPEEHEAVRLTGTPAVYNGVVMVPVASWEESRALNPDYPCCTFRGSIVALRVRDGAPVWKTYLIPEPPKVTGKTSAGTATLGPSGAGVWGSPTVDLKRKLLYITSGDNYSKPDTANSDSVLALELATGKIMWSRQTLPGDVYNSACGTAKKGSNCPDDSGPDHDFGSAALLVKTAAGRDLILAGQKSGVVYALDPDKKGEIVWQTRVGKGGIVGGVQWGMASDAQNVYAAVSDAVFTSTASSRSLDPNAGGGLNALKLEDGSKVWITAPQPCGSRAHCSPAQSAAVTAIPGVVFSGSLDGHLRGYTTEEGKVIWDFDTAREFQTVNGVKATGGSIDGAGPMVMNGMLLVNSGYTRYGGMPGNVLLAFEPEK